MHQEHLYHCGLLGYGLSEAHSVKIRAYKIWSTALHGVGKVSAFVLFCTTITINTSTVLSPGSVFEGACTREKSQDGSRALWDELSILSVQDADP